MLNSNDFPFSPRKFPFFYGWVVVAAATVGMYASIPGQTMGVSVFTDSLMEALGLTRLQLSTAYLWGTICSGFMLIRIGALVDRMGVRRTVVVASIGLALGLAGLGFSGEIANAISAHFRPAARMPIAMATGIVGFFCIRFMGQGILTMSSRIMMGKWFNRKRGLAIGVSGLFVTFGFGSSPIFLNALIDYLGWQQAYLALAGLIGVGMSVVGWALYRERPEDCGLYPDGILDPRVEDESPSNPSVATREFTVKEARKSYVFWVFSAGLGTQGLVVTAVTFHIMSIARASGLTEEQGIAIFLPIALMSAASNFVAGWVSDKTKLKYVLMAMMAMQALGTVGLYFMDHPLGRLMLILGFGASGGMFGTLVGVAWPRFFGLAHLGAISSLNMSVMVFSSALGPFLFGLSEQRTGSYSISIGACLLLPLLVFVAAIRANSPQKQGL